MTFKQMLKSKTVDFNIIVASAVGMASVLGYEVPTEVVAGILGTGNFILRLVTKKPISEK